jgi:Tol biopolymer transport system component
VSRDGQWLVFGSRDEQHRQVFIVCRLAQCRDSRVFVTPFNRGIRWLPDGTGFAGVDRATSSNIWIQPLDGSPLRGLTHFADGRVIDDFAWSRDGNQLAIARSTTTNDIVLFRGLKGR